VKDTAFCQSQSIEVGGVLLDFNKPLTMGVINATSDSFYAGSRTDSIKAVLAKAGQMVSEGADIIDIGAYSTRPNADDVPQEEERKRLVEAIGAVRSHYPDMVISADTFRARVAEAAVEAGAQIINDVGGGLLDDGMADVVASLKVPYVLMHNRGMPKEMQKKAIYTDVAGEVVLELSRQLRVLRTKGISDVIIDPGFGFAKTIEHNFELLMRLGELHILDAPLLVGVSRKSMIWRTLGITAHDALNGTTALHMLALERGAHMLRVHDVRPAVEAIKLWEACKAKSAGS